MSTRFTSHAANPDALRNSDAQVTGFTRNALMQEVRADAECRASDEHLRSIMHWMPIIMLATDRDGIITLAEGNGLGNAGLSSLVKVSAYCWLVDFSPVHLQRRR